LSAKLRGDMNAQLPHLAARRKSGYLWNLGAMGIKVCETFIEFVDELQASDPGRAEWFAAAYQRAVDAIPPKAAADPGPEVERRPTSVDTTSPPTLSASMPMTTTSPESKVTVIRALPLERRPGPGVEE
jgi:hypothetical protein